MSKNGLKDLKERYPHVLIKDPAEKEENDLFLESPPRGNMEKMMTEIKSIVNRLINEEKKAKTSEGRRKIMEKNNKLVAKFSKQLDDKYNKKYFARNGIRNVKDLEPYKTVPDEVLKQWVKMGKLGAGDLTGVVRERLGAPSESVETEDENPFNEQLEREIQVTRNQYLKYLKE